MPFIDGFRKLVFGLLFSQLVSWTNAMGK